MQRECQQLRNGKDGWCLFRDPVPLDGALGIPKINEEWLIDHPRIRRQNGHEALSVPSGRKGPLPHVVGGVRGVGQKSKHRFCQIILSARRILILTIVATSVSTSGLVFDFLPILNQVGRALVSDLHLTPARQAQRTP